MTEQMFDFNDAAPQQDFSPMPNNTMAKFISEIKPGGIGQDGILTQSKSSDAQYINFVFTATDGPFKGRKVFQVMVVSGGKIDESGQSIAAGITRGTLLAILNSARKLDPADNSDRARGGRVIKGYADFHGMEFAGRVKLVPAKDGYDAKNQLNLILQPGHENYNDIMSGAGGQVDGMSAPVTASNGQQQASWEGNSGDLTQRPTTAGKPTWA